MNEGIKAIIFDFDGVILESAGIKTEAFLELFAEYPEHQGAILQHHLDNLGVSRFDKFEWIYRELLDRPLDQAERQRLSDCFSAICLEKIMACPAVTGALEALEKLQDGHWLFVASGTPQSELETIVERRGLAGYFDEVWGTPHGKAEIIEDILERYALERDEALMVGDGLSDYEAAVAAGVRFLARETPEQEHVWRRMGIKTVADLEGLGERQGREVRTEK